MLTPKYLTKSLFLSIIVVSTLVACSESKKTGTVTEAKESAANQSEQNEPIESEIKTSEAQFTLQAKKAVADAAKLSTEELGKKYNLNTVDKQTLISTMITANQNLDVESLKKLGVQLQSKTGNIQSALVPIDQLANLKDINGIETIDVPTKAKSK